MLGGSILLDKYSRHIADDIEAGGFTISASLFNVIEGGNHVAMAKTACLTALEFTNGLHALDPDIVVICGDRFEQLAIAMAGGVPEQDHRAHRGRRRHRQHRRERAARDHQARAHALRHQRRRRAPGAGDGRGSAITSSTPARSTSSWRRASTDGHQRERVNSYGVGHHVDLTQPFLIVIQHPVTTERDNRRTSRDDAATRSRRWTCRRSGSGRTRTPAPARWPRSLRHFREQHGELTDGCGSSPTCPPTSSSRCSRQAACLVGNSSAGIKECSYLGTPVVNIGGRQQGRLHGPRRARAVRRGSTSKRRLPRSSRTAAIPRRASTTVPTRASRSSTCSRARSCTRRSAFSTTWQRRRIGACEDLT